MGASLVCMCVFTFDAVVQAPIIEIFGYASAGNQIALTIVMIWGAVALSAVFPTLRSPSALREILSAIATFFIVLIIIIGLVALCAGRPPLHVAGLIAASSFILITVIIGLRWKRWSRGFVLGQVMGVLAAGNYFAIAEATGGSFLLRLQQGIANGIGDGIWWGLAFALAERMSGARAAIIAGLLLAALKNIVATPWTLLPLVALWTAYAFIRRRSLAKARILNEQVAVS
jgi:hypothetical protein